MKLLKAYLKDEGGMGTVEIILIIVEIYTDNKEYLMYSKQLERRKVCLVKKN